MTTSFALDPIRMKACLVHTLVDSMYKGLAENTASSTSHNYYTGTRVFFLCTNYNKGLKAQ